MKLRRTFLLLALITASCTSTSPDRATEPDPAPSTQDTVAPPTQPAAPTTSAIAPFAELRMVTLNVLHGLALPDSCGSDTDNCQVTDRLKLLWEAIDTGAGCPEVIALQEIGPRQIELIPEMLPDLCDGNHRLIFHLENGFDQEMILTTLPVLEESFVDLSGPVWTAHWVRLGTEAGPVDIFTTHFASSSFNPDCLAGDGIESCPPICPVGIEMGSCHSLETLAWLDPRNDSAAAQFILGDLNKVIDDPRIRILTDAGFNDVYLEAGNGECVAATGEWCTSGIDGEGLLAGLDDPAATFDDRIDFVLYRSGQCDVALDDLFDSDGDGTSTGLFDVGPYDPPVNGLVWISDHRGIQADVSISCGPG